MSHNLHEHNFEQKIWPKEIHKTTKYIFPKPNWTATPFSTIYYSNVLLFFLSKNVPSFTLMYLKSWSKSTITQKIYLKTANIFTIAPRYARDIFNLCCIVDFVERGGGLTSHDRLNRSENYLLLGFVLVSPYYMWSYGSVSQSCW